jgi:hypothetical protein
MNMRRLPDAFDLESLILKAPDFREHRALLWMSKKNPKPKTGIVVIHPRADFTHHYVIPRLVDAGRDADLSTSDKTKPISVSAKMARFM